MTKRNVYEVLLKKQRPPVTGWWYLMKNGYYNPLNEEDRLVVEEWRNKAGLPQREPSSSLTQTPKESTKNV